MPDWSCGEPLRLLHYQQPCARIWWNWQTRYFEVVVGQPVQVQVLLCAPVLNLQTVTLAEVGLAG